MSGIQLPGLIDIHVHLRDPGQTHKEDFYTGTSAALAGGITTVLDMPNNAIPVFSEAVLDKKMSIAAKSAVCDYGFYFGTDGRNIQEFEKVKNRVGGLKLYLTETTGHYLVKDKSLLENVFGHWPKEKVIVVHAENDKVDSVLNIGKEYGNKMHIAHVNTQATLQKIIDAKNTGMNLTCDVTPHHLFLTKDDIQKLKGFGIMKPPLVGKSDQEFLWSHLKDIDCIASDHAPHTIPEKQSNNPPYGVPGLETMLPLLLTAVSEKRLTMSDIVRLTNTNPKKIFGLSQSKDTYVEIDPDETYEIKRDNLKTKCGWSPFEGLQMKGRVKCVYLRGVKVFEGQEILVPPGFGKCIV